EGWRTFFAITEPSGGSDPAGAIQTRAERRGETWVLNGRKVFISNVHNGKWGVVFARTSKEKGRGGISCFIVEPGTPGLSWKNIQRQAVQWMLADAEVELRACRWLIWEGAWKADRGEDARVEASIAKLYSSEVLGRVVDAAVQIHGGYGVSKEFPLERWYREARVRRIGEGPSEVHRMVIARQLFR